MATMADEKKKSLAEKFVRMLEQIPPEVQEKALYMVEGMAICAGAQRGKEEASENSLPA